MTDQITLKKALKLVKFTKTIGGDWCISRVNDHVWGNVRGDVRGVVIGTINGRAWQYVETPKERLRRLIEEDAHTDLLMEAFNQLEES